MIAELETRKIGEPAVEESDLEKRRGTAMRSSSHSTVAAGYHGEGASDPELWLYRDRTVALLRRYLRLSLQVGRLPSLLGREMMRAHITYYRAATFEDAVIFVHDVERCLEELPAFEQMLIAALVLKYYTQRETALHMGCAVRTISRCYPEAIDRVSEMFLRRGILSPLPGAAGGNPVKRTAEADFV
jgi:hypothetical protein